MNLAANVVSQEYMETQNFSANESQTWTSVCAASDMIENIGQCALIKGRQIAIFSVTDSDEIYAIDNFDPFSDTNVLSRGVVGDIKGTLVVASPIYKQHFALETGQCLEDETVKLNSYPVRVVDGIVQIAC